MVVVGVVLARAFTMSLATDARAFASLTTSYIPKAVAQHLGRLSSVGATWDHDVQLDGVREMTRLSVEKPSVADSSWTLCPDFHVRAAHELSR